jgi:lipopolysaccharide export LptBFGC system permease protein LptF
MIFSLFVTPDSLKEIRFKIIEIRSSGIQISLLKEKKFISPTSDLTIFIQEKKGNDIFGLLIHDQSNANSPQTYIAEKGRFISNNLTNFLRLFNGTIQLYNNNENRITEIAFDTYDLNLLPYRTKESSYIYPDELSTAELFENIENKSINSLSKREKEQFAELHSRIINPFYIFFYSLLPLLMIKFSNRPDDNWLIPIICVSAIAFTVQILQITLSNLLIENSNLILFNYLLPFVLIVVLMISLFFEYTFKILKKQNV